MPHIPLPEGMPGPRDENRFVEEPMIPRECEICLHHRTNRLVRLLVRTCLNQSGVQHGCHLRRNRGFQMLAIREVVVQRVGGHTKSARNRPNRHALQPILRKDFHCRPKNRSSIGFRTLRHDVHRTP